MAGGSQMRQHVALQAATQDSHWPIQQPPCLGRAAQAGDHRAQRSVPLGQLSGQAARRRIVGHRPLDDVQQRRVPMLRAQCVQLGGIASNHHGWHAGVEQRGDDAHADVARAANDGRLGLNHPTHGIFAPEIGIIPCRAHRACSPVRCAGAPPACRRGELENPRKALLRGRFSAETTGSKALSIALR